MYHFIDNITKLYVVKYQRQEKNQRIGARLACRRRRRDLQGAQRRNSENPFSRHIISFPNCLYGRQTMPLALLWFLLALKARKKPNEPGRAWLLVPKAGLEPARCCQQRILSPSRLPFHHFGNFYRKIISQISELVNCLT